MLKRRTHHISRRTAMQPPSGGCVLKLFAHALQSQVDKQPPSGGCVLKRVLDDYGTLVFKQPPSGGCVLKQPDFVVMERFMGAATFGWLCVETPMV